MRRALRIFKRLVEVVLVLIVLATIAVLVLNYTAWGRERIRKYAEGKLQSAFPGGAKIGKLEGSIFDELTISDIEIDARDGKPMVTVGKVVVSADLPALFGETVRLDRVEIDQVTVSIRPQPPAPPEPPSPPSSGGGSSWSIEMPRLELTNGTVEIALASGPPILVTKLDLGGSLMLPAGGKIVSRLAARGEWQDKPMIATAIASYDGGKLSIPWASLGGLRSFACVLDGHYDDGSDLVSGVVTVKTPAATVEKWSGIKLPGDILAVASASGTTNHNHIGLDGLLGDARLVSYGFVDVKKKSLKLFASASADDLAPVTFGKVQGHGAVTAAIELGAARAVGIASVHGAVGDTEDSTAVVLADTDFKTATLDVLARRATAQASVIATVSRTNTDFHLDRGWLLARATDPHVRGVATAALSGTGPLTPAPRIVVNGTIHGDSIGYQVASLTSLDVTLHNFVASASPTGNVGVVATNLRASGVVIPKATLDTTISYTDVLGVAINSHAIETLAGTWSGKGGTIKAGPSIVVDNLHTGSLGSAITVTHASYQPVTQNLTAKLDAQNVNVGAFVPAGRGMLEGNVDVARTNGSWSGTAHAFAHGVWVGEQDAGIEGEATVKLQGHRVEVEAKATDADLGDLTLVADIDGPRDLTDATAWGRLPRTSVRSATIDVTRFDAAKAGASGAGKGQIAIENGQIRGEIHVDGVEVGTNILKVDTTVGSGDGDEIAADSTASLSNVVTANAIARIAFPEHLFDPKAWKALDRRALAGVVVNVDDNFDPSVWAALGYDLPYRGHVKATVDINEGALGAAVIAQVTDVTGGLIVKPIGAKVVGGIESNGVHAQADLVVGDVPILTAVVDSPLTVDQVAAHQARSAPVVGTVTIPLGFARELTAIVGRSEIRSGTVSGSIDVGGTFGMPTGKGTLAVRDIVLSAVVGGRDQAKLDALDLTSTWDGAIADVHVTASEKAGGTLDVHVAGKPTGGIAALTADIGAKEFDIAPLAAFVPGTFSATTGTIKLADVKYDPASGKLSGRTHLVDASIPLTATIGTLRETKADIEIAGDTVTANVEGRLGGGTVHLDSTVTLAGAMPRTVEGSGRVHKISPLGKYQPTIDADLPSIKLARDPDTGKWTGSIKVENGNAEMSLAKADQLFAVGAPSDMVFVDAPQKSTSAKDIHIPPPEDAWLDVAIRLDPTTIYTYDPRAQGIVGDIHAVVEGDLRFQLGDGMGLDGTLVTDRGDVDLVGRRYDVEIADLSFDGTIYPKINIKITHQFPELALSVEVHGEAPSDFTVTPTADVSGYSEDQLYGFVFGGEPGGDPANAAKDAATAAGGTLLSSTFGKRLTRFLPQTFRPDTLKYAPQTATSSASTEIGKWFSRPWLPGTIYLAFRNRITPLVTENANEAEAEWYLQKRVLLDVSVGDHQYDGADLLYRLRW